jgi:RNA polymerase sigma-70 factor (ECF subfamily)
VDDPTLARALARGDEAAFRQLIDQQTGAVFRTCYRVLGSIDEAEDAVQETFVLAYRALRSYRGEGPPGAWLARIALRESWRRSRSRSREATRTTVLDDAIEAAAADPTDVTRLVLAAEERAEVRRAVAALPDPYREVVALRFLADRSVADISVLLGRPEATVKTQLYRGLARLRALLDEGAR